MVCEKGLVRWKQKITITAICLCNRIALAAKVITSDDAVKCQRKQGRSDTVQILSRDEIPSMHRKRIIRTFLVKWQEYDASDATVHDGVIPVNLLSDEIYCSMNLPSESRSNEMIQMNRITARLCPVWPVKQKPIVGSRSHLQHSWGRFTGSFHIMYWQDQDICLSDKIGNWAIIDEQPYPDGVYSYKMPWTEHKSKKMQ